MTTPSSSATSPSPPMSYLQPIVPMVPANQGASTSSFSSLSPSMDPLERERRKKAVQKFLARAELSNVTRTLRTRLSYASFKTSHNPASTSFGDLEAQSQGSSSAMMAARSYAAKRKAPSQPIGNGRGSPRTPALNGNFGASNSAESNTHTLFTSILAPPPPNLARTILNANDPPVAAPVRPAMSPKVRNAKVVRSIAESTRAQAKSRRQPKDKGKSRKAVDADGDVDMEAAATLTSLLLHHRPSIAGSDTSEPGTHSARSSFAPIPPNPASNASTSYRSNTPPRSSNNTPAQQTTPRPAPTDNEAADLMLYLATSPSPARASGSKNSRDAAAFRALGNPNPVNNANNGNMMRAKPRVLFPTTQGEPNHDDSNPGSSRRGSRGSLGRNDSFAGSSMSSIGSDMGARTSDRNNPTSPQHLPPPSTHGAHLLPPPSLPTHGHPHHSSSNFPSSPSTLRQESSSRPTPSDRHPGAGGQVDYNFSEYVHPPPAPRFIAGGGGGGPMHPGSNNSHAHAQAQAQAHAPSPSLQKSNLGLRADVGRKLFEEEQIRLQHQKQKRRPDDRSLEAGIDLVRT